jgi:hypothetical protein
VSSYSTVTFAEIRQDALKRKGYATIQDFFADFEGAFFPIDPNPNIMIAAGELKDAKATNPSDAKTTKQRVIGTADAIHLATCLYIRDVMGVKDIIFHTFDNGKGATWEGKCVPLLTFERWFPAASRAGRVLDVCGLTRSKPEHPAPRFSGMTPNAATVNSSGST